MGLLPGQVLVNRYRIVKLVGQGGFGAVYRAWDTTLHVPVAVKENLDTSPEAQRQFEGEALLLAPLHHTNLPRVTDHFFIPGQGQYLVMDFVEGRNLEEILKERGHVLDEAEALPWIGQVCDALDYLHRQTPPVIHRDIKPQNIIIDADGRAMLVDFGISKVYDPSLVTTVGARAVTPGYSPPEQYGIGKTDARSDVYALGATLYTILTGAAPPESIGLMTGAETLTPIRQTNPRVSLRTEAAITAAMALAASQRLSGVGVLRDALAGKAMAPLPAVGRPVVLSEASERRAAWVWMPAVVGLAVVAIIAVGAFLLLRDRDGGAAGGVVEATATTAATHTAEATATTQPAATVEVVVATKTAEPVASATQPPPPANSPTPIPLPVAGATRVAADPSSDENTSIYVPAGSFRMGSEDGNNDERPIHEVALDDFWLDQTEVSNARFAAFVADASYQTTAEAQGWGYLFDGGNWDVVSGADWRHPQGPGSSIDGLDDHPVVLVNRADAAAFCEWAGGRLPTEAEWEYAARGPDNRLWAWGDEFLPDRVNYCDHDCSASWVDLDVDDGYTYTAPIGSYPDGASWVGALNMTGNVWEWVSDWYAADYYHASPTRNPSGPDSGELGLLRGGSWVFEPRRLRATDRNSTNPNNAINDFGIRCAYDAD